MRIVIAPDKFKGSLDAAAAAQAAARGILHAAPGAVVDICPMADGGEGTVQALVAATGGRIVREMVTGPLPGARVEAEFGMLENGAAIVEMAAASGLHLLDSEHRNPMRTTTFGVGELLRAAARLGARRIILGVGGSATVDGGIGCAQAWGAAVRLENGTTYGPADRKLTGADVAKVLSVHMPHERRRARFFDSPAVAEAPRLAFDPIGVRPADERMERRRDEPADDDAPPADIEFVVACDVGNPLIGPDGAARIFGPQKGATPEQVKALDDALRQLAIRTGHLAEAEKAGAGAAGGLGFAMMAFFNASVQSGAKIVLEATRLRERLAGADLCITGEGRLDAQSLAGKTVSAVAALCGEAGIPCIALAGEVDAPAEQLIGRGLSAAFSITNGAMTLQESMERAGALIEAAAANVMRTFLARR